MTRNSRHPLFPFCGCVHIYWNSPVSQRKITVKQEYAEHPCLPDDAREAFFSFGSTEYAQAPVLKDWRNISTLIRSVKELFYESH